MTAALIEQRDRLTDRLWDGDARILQAKNAGEDVSVWEDFWIQILREYEDVCRQLDALSAISSTASQPSRDERQAPLMNARGAW